MGEFLGVGEVNGRFLQRLFDGAQVLNQHKFMMFTQDAAVMDDVDQSLDDFLSQPAPDAVISLGEEVGNGRFPRRCQLLMLNTMTACSLL